MAPRLAAELHELAGWLGLDGVLVSGRGDLAPALLSAVPDVRGGTGPLDSGAVPMTVQPRVRLIAWTQFQPPADIDWSTDADGGQALAEFAGRACYQAWDKANPATATNAGYLQHILQVGHLAVLEHATATFHLTGLSASVAHEIVRHRHLSCSQLSPRYQPTGDAPVSEPAAIAADPALHEQFVTAVTAATEAHTALLAGLERSLGGGAPAGLRAKQARQLARAVLPDATETQLVVTGNFRAWRHFVAVRGSEHADTEIRALALACLRGLTGLAPHVFADFEVVTLPDGTEVASSPLAAEG